MRCRPLLGTFLVLVSLSSSRGANVVVWGDNQYGQVSGVPASLTNAVAIAAGAFHMLAIRADGGVSAWGRNAVGPTSVPAGLRDVVAVAAGEFHSLALTGDGTVHAWGDNSYGQTAVPPGLSNIVAIAAGQSHCLALDADGRVTAWGRNDHGQCDIPEDLGAATAITAGRYCSFARLQGQWMGWGDNSDGQLVIPPAAKRASMHAASYHNLAADPGFSLTAWGRSNYGQTAVPPGLGPVMGIAAGAYHSLAIQTNRTCVAWGRNGAGQINVPPSLNRVAAVAGGYAFSAAIRSRVWLAEGLSDVTALVGQPVVLRVAVTGDLPVSYQWYRNGVALPGARSAELVLPSVDWEDAGRYRVAVSSADGAVSTAARVQVSMVATWITWRDPPIVAGMLPGISNVVAAEEDVALLGNGRVVYAGTGYDQTASSGLTNIVAISACTGHGLAVRADGQVQAWGWYSNCDPEPAYVPQGVSNAVAVGTGTRNDVVLRADGTVTAWGLQDYWNAPRPWFIPHVDDAVAVAAGDLFDLCLRSNGRIVAWDNDVERDVPASLTNVVAIDASGDTCIALHGDGTLSSWELDSGTVTSFRGDMAYVDAAQNWSGLAALRADGRVDGWGIPAPAGLSGVVDVAEGDDGLLVLVGSGPPAIRPMVRRTRTGVGVPCHLRVQATGAHPLSYQWVRDGVPVPGATGASISIVESAAGVCHYTCRVSNAVGTASSTSVEVTVEPIRLPPLVFSDEVLLGQVWTVEARVDSGLPVTFFWYRNGVLMEDEHLPTLSVPASLAHAGVYRLVASNAYGTVSASAEMHVSAVAAWGYDCCDQFDVPSGLSNVVGVASGECHGLALRRDGSVVQWGGIGYGGYERVPPVPEGLGAVAIAGGAEWSHALLSNGAVVTWGARQPELDNVTAIAASTALHVDGRITRWSDTGRLLPAPVGITNAVALDGSGAVLADGTIAQWSYYDGQPVPTPALSNVQAFASGSGFGMALHRDGTVTVWGDRSEVPSNLTDIAAIDAYACHAAVLHDTGAVSAWHPYLGGYPGTVPPESVSNAVAIAVGYDHGLAWLGERDGAAPVMLPGSREFVVLPNTPFYLPAKVVGKGPFHYQWHADGAPAADGNKAVLTAVRAQLGTGTYQCIVSNAYGSVTGDSIRVTTVPARIRGASTNVVSIGQACGLDVTIESAGSCAVTWERNGVVLPGVNGARYNIPRAQPGDAGRYRVTVSNAWGVVSREILLDVSVVAAWGDGYEGQTQVPFGLGAVTAVAAGHSHSLALRADGTVSAWGGNACGQVGVPPGLADVTAIAGGYWHSLALRRDGTVRAWGDNTGRQADVPAELDGVVAIAGGFWHSLALRADGAVVAWGTGEGGAVGMPSVLTGITAISAGDWHSLALRSDGTVVAWGNNDYGQTDVPIGLTSVAAVSAGGDHSLALRQDGSVVAWGRNGNGQCDVPPGLGSVVAVAASDAASIALLADGTLVTWGYAVTTAPPELADVTSIAAGSYHGLAIISGKPVSLMVLPDEPLAASVTPGGDCVPDEKTYLVLNEGSRALEWKAECSEAWFTVAPAEGHLEAGENVLATVRITAPPQCGYYAGTVIFSNVTSGAWCARQVTLTAEGHAILRADPGFFCITSRPGRVESRLLTLGNDAAATQPLVVSVSTRFEDEPVAAARSTAVAAAPAVTPFASLQPGRDYVEGEMLVRFDPNLGARQRDEALAAAGGGRVVRSYGLVPGLTLVRVPTGLAVANAAVRYARGPGIRHASPNFIRHATGTPNDPLFASQWGLHNTGQYGGSVDADVDAPEAWSNACGGAGAIIAVIDTGVDYLHGDLVGNIWTNPNEIPGNGRDDDGNGWVDDVHGYDFCNGDGDPMDDHGHGTHCAGIAAATADNGTGVAGVSWRSRVMALKFLSAAGSGYDSDAIGCIDYAVRMGARVLSNSWGGGGYSPALADAIEAAGVAGTVSVAAAGNDSEDTDIYPHYPSSYDVPSLIAVMATDWYDARSGFSNYGANSVDLGAPGSFILSCRSGGGYVYMSGTSMATPMVAGACAVLQTAHAGLTPGQVKAALLGSVDPTLPGQCVSGGRMNLQRALDAVPHWLNIAPASGHTFEPGAGTNLTVTFHAEHLLPGTHRASLEIASNDSRHRLLTIGVELVVVPETIPASWLERYRLPTDGSADHLDSDGDRLDNWAEWVAGTDPTNAHSVLRIEDIRRVTDGTRIQWQSVSNRHYDIQRAESPVTEAFLNITSGIPGTAPSASFIDPDGGEGPRFYRVGVQAPAP